LSGETVRFGEASVFVREVGSGPPLLLINGLGAHTAMWAPLERTLAGFRIIEFDLPGAGQSPAPWRPISVPRLARLTTQVLDRFGVERVNVIGYSMGGIVAQQLAADFPERVRRVALVATTPGMGAVQGDLKALVNIMTPLRYVSAGMYARTIGSMVGGRARHDAKWVAEQGSLRLKHAPPWRGYAGQLMSLATWSGLPALARIDAPVLVLSGDDDPLTPVANGMMLAHLLPDARLRVVRDEGHLMLLDADSACHSLLRDFICAEPLSQAPVWQQASTVSAEELRIALAGTGRQLPPWSIVNALMRRRWLQT